MRSGSSTMMDRGRRRLFLTDKGDAEGVSAKIRTADFNVRCQGGVKPDLILGRSKRLKLIPCGLVSLLS